MSFIYFCFMKRYRNKKRTPKIREYKISNSLISEYFGYSSVETFNNSSSKARIIQGIESIIDHIESYIKK